MDAIVKDGIEAYAEAHTTAPQPHLAELAAYTREHMAGPQMLVGHLEGRYLELLVHMAKPQRVLEIGTFTGYSALAMAEALPPGGHITTLDISEEHAAVARRHTAASPHADRITVIVGPALDTLATLDGPFDFVFIDADKTKALTNEAPSCPPPLAVAAAACPYYAPSSSGTGGFARTQLMGGWNEEGLGRCRSCRWSDAHRTGPQRGRRAAGVRRVSERCVLRTARKPCLEGDGRHCTGGAGLHVLHVQPAALSQLVL